MGGTALISRFEITNTLVAFRDRNLVAVLLHFNDEFDLTGRCRDDAKGLDARSNGMDVKKRRQSGKAKRADDISAKMLLRPVGEQSYSTT